MNDRYDFQPTDKTELVVNGFQQLTPDRSFASVPYAMSAGSGDQDGSKSRALF